MSKSRLTVFEQSPPTAPLAVINKPSPLAVIKQSLAEIKQSPLVAPGFPYGFDKWVEIAVALSEWREKMWQACDDLEQEPCRTGIILAQALVDRYTDHDLETMLLKWKAGDDWYNRSELYDNDNHA